MPPVPESVDHSKIDFRRYYFWATILNVPPILFMYPLRTVRLLQQSKVTSPVPNSIFKVIRDVYRKNGVQALFAGSAIYTTGVTTTKILQFATYDYAAQVIKQHRYFGYPILKDSRVLSGVLGTFSAIVTTFFIVPFDMISQQITIAKAGALPNTSNMPLYVTGYSEPLEKPKPMTLTESLRAQYRQEGTRFLFRGYFATLLSTGPFFAAYFPAYEISRYWIKGSIDYIRDIQAARRPNPNPFPPLQSHQFLISSMAGSIASVAGVVVSSPCDMIKTRIQTEQRLQPTNASGIKLPLPTLNWMDVFKEIWKKEGLMAFFSGTRARAIRAIPGGAFNFLIFDYVRSKSLKEVVPVPPVMQAERQEMLETLFTLEKQFQPSPTPATEDWSQSVLLSVDDEIAPDMVPITEYMEQPSSSPPPSSLEQQPEESPEQLPPIAMQQEN
ncbi:hypothetical protein BX616_003835 [Lobosporangium transversale]|uniref:Mitochondrial carrier domain-containing protein n=1 Tax=Lobosporangium transversale TaxID=64571 RepID=A0A1Y2GQZ8_9FUNG|nr:mitochondrial carrier domain-containing protein [Lobosporangium transversale]KAF9898591.1 hypothetical protein BX616_003835 [Lobosporangium transversale]ORZ19953.1 mitochondrial carrier domain-containing protein [Lobosporangium transversale]|eukprot:XP_021882493.1 mitochondrial carrier domain-containing protein [Lobosporangium transversale]